jgi:hypothetical protein
MFHARRRRAGGRLVADDVTWTAGAGPEVRGSISALLLVLTGRPVALAQLSGPGLEVLRTRSAATRGDRCTRRIGQPTNRHFTYPPV